MISLKCELRGDDAITNRLKLNSNKNDDKTSAIEKRRDRRRTRKKSDAKFSFCFIEISNYQHNIRFSHFNDFNEPFCIPFFYRNNIFFSNSKTVRAKQISCRIDNFSISMMTFSSPVDCVL